MKKIWKIYGEESIDQRPQIPETTHNADAIYNNPSAILNEYANQLFLDSDKLFNGIVTESTGGNSNEITYALYVISHKLKDYMYRLIEVTVPNIIEPYPLEITLFAKDPKNHRTFSCGNVKEFRKKLVELIESPITSIILKHLKNIIEININNNVKNYHFTLTDKAPLQTIILNENFLPITIKKIILSSHIGKEPNLWGQIIANSSIQITIKNTENGYSVENSISLLQFFSVYQIQPVLELNLILPDYEYYSKNKLSKNEINFNLVSEHNNIKFDVYYEIEEESV
jgi:hypothetical protein